MQEAVEALKSARSEVAAADERATAAEMAKIQLSMRLAELDDVKAQLLKKDSDLTVSTVPEGEEEVWLPPNPLLNHASVLCLQPSCLPATKSKLAT